MRTDRWNRGTRWRGERAAAERAERGTAEWQARNLRHLLDHPPMETWGAGRAALLRYVTTYHPRTLEVLGDAVVSAAVTTPSGGACRWCVALLHRRARGEPPPAYTAAYAEVLGPPCADCARRTMTSLAARVAAGRRTDRPARRRAPTAEPAARTAVQTTAGRFHAAGRCATCAAAGQLGLTAGAVPGHRASPVLPRDVRRLLLARRVWHARRSP